MNNEMQKLKNQDDALKKLERALENTDLKTLKLNLGSILITVKSIHKKVEQQITHIRKNCNHKFKYDGHGHNDDCYKCEYCEETEWR